MPDGVFDGCWRVSGLSVGLSVFHVRRYVGRLGIGERGCLDCLAHWCFCFFWGRG